MSEELTEKHLQFRIRLEMKGKARVLVCMGSDSDWPTMVQSCIILNQFSVPFHVRILSAHRTPDRLQEHAKKAADHDGYGVIIAGAGMAAHLAGMFAAWTRRPVIGVPITGSTDTAQAAARDSTLMMPKGVPVLTVAPGKHGAYNAGYAAVSILALGDEKLDKELVKFRNHQTISIPEEPEWP